MQRIMMGLCIALVATMAAAEDLAKVKEDFEKNIPGMKIDQLKPAPLPGMYEVVSEGQVLYISADGRYILHGDLYDRTTSSNLTEQTRGGINAKLLARVDDSKTIVFAPKNPKYTVTVFTDTSCGYCRKLHKEVPELNKRGVKVRYMLFPRAGLGSADARVLESVWCAQNQQEAMNTAKAGGQVSPKTCANPISEHIKLGRKLGLQGTPMLITPKGTVIGGYMQYEELVATLEKDAQSD
ncbi:MAG TPA: DsbC family protein [Gammaproteobacteria bacterium]